MNLRYYNVNICVKCSQTLHWYSCNNKWCVCHLMLFISQSTMEFIEPDNFFFPQSSPVQLPSVVYHLPAHIKIFFSKSGRSCFKPILSNPFTCKARVEVELLSHAAVYVTTRANSIVCRGRIYLFLISECMCFPTFCMYAIILEL